MTSSGEQRISIIVPVYNEEDSLRLPATNRLPPRCSNCRTSRMRSSSWTTEVTDGSVDLLRSLHAEDPEHVAVILLRRNFGQTAAMSAGFDAATGDLIIPMDADLQNDPNDIGRLLEKINEGYDVVSGWRAERHDTFVTRRLPSMTANMLISRMTGVHLHDYGCTLKAYRREVVEHMNLYGELHRFLPALASWAGANVTEIKVNHRARQFGTSKYGIGRTLRVVLDLITVKFLLSYSTKPMQVFGKWGFLSIFVGLLAGLFAAEQWLVRGQDVTDSPYMFACIFFMLGGPATDLHGVAGRDQRAHLL